MSEELKHFDAGKLIDYVWDLRAERDQLRAELSRIKAGQGEAVAIPDECPHMIVFDDTERSPLMFAGAGARDAALKTWEKISGSWNAHLFVRIERNSRDDRYPSVTVVAPPTPDATQVMVPRELLDRAIANLSLLDARPRSLCRDCADYNGVCPGGLDCDISALVTKLRALLAQSEGVKP